MAIVHLGYEFVTIDADEILVSLKLRWCVIPMPPVFTGGSQSVYNYDSLLRWMVSDKNEIEAAEEKMNTASNALLAYIEKCESIDRDQHRQLLARFKKLKPSS